MHSPIKAAGGKARLVPDLIRLIPPHVGQRSDRCYYEPFFGGGALFWALVDRSGAGFLSHATLADANEDLMGMYNVLGSDYDSDAVTRGLTLLFQYLNRHAISHAEIGKEHYYQQRDILNARRDGFGMTDYWESYTEDDAARFIYLNRAGFNGLWRVNQKGQMNVPAGDFKGDATKIMDAFDVQNLSACSIALCKAHITAGDYTDVLRTASAGDFVYLDPPYHGMYAGYTSDGFDDEDHRALAQVAKDLVARGVRVLISNSDTELVRELYTCDDFKIGTLPCMHSIAASGDKRKRVDELVIAGGGVRDWKQTELLL